jgi:hypothetical protein
MTSSSITSSCYREWSCRKGNPARVTHTGDGDNYRVDNVYHYDGLDRPLTTSGDFVYLTGPDAGKHFQTRSVFTYY